MQPFRHVSTSRFIDVNKVMNMIVIDFVFLSLVMCSDYEKEVVNTLNKRFRYWTGMLQQDYLPNFRVFNFLLSINDINTLLPC